MESFLYRVNKGENLISISEKLQVPPFRIISDNSLKCEVHAGQVLVIKKQNARLYRVQPFDTIDGLCQRFCIAKKDFIYLNRTEFIYFGLLLYI